jgi:hypothetical protein
MNNLYIRYILFMGENKMNNYKKEKYQICLIIIIFFLFTVPNINGYMISDNNNFDFEIGTAEAINIANKFLLGQQEQDYQIFGISEIKDDYVNTTLSYVIYLDPKGFIVVTNDINLPPIISYSFSDEFGQICQENMLLEILKTDISIRLKHVDKLSFDIKEKRHNLWKDYLSGSNVFEQSSLMTAIGPLLETKWSQSPPYNNYCPIDKATGQRSLAGCPAVAMAQILNYHRTTQDIQFDDNDDYVHNYGGNYYKIDDDSESYDFPSFPELNSYLITLQGHYENDIPLTDQDKAAINFASGVAAKQVYSSGGSGTFGVNQAFNAYKRFSFDETELLDEDDPDLYDRLQENVLDGLPVHIAVVNEGWTAGHNMVVDGYNDQGFYHINFGWGGSYDNWYDLPDELPFDLTVIEGIIVDIKPTNPESNLDGDGVLSWSNVKPSSTVTGSFCIKNIGEPDSSIDWKISSYPEWGTWTFNPESGKDLKPEDGEISIELILIAPKNKNEEFAGYVKIVNENSPGDHCLIHATMTTPRINKVDGLMINIIKTCFSRYPILKNLFYE